MRLRKIPVLLQWDPKRSLADSGVSLEEPESLVTFSQGSLSCVYAHGGFAARSKVINLAKSYHENYSMKLKFPRSFVRKTTPWAVQFGLYSGRIFKARLPTA